jgi:uncharacterized protein DUF3644
MTMPSSITSTELIEKSVQAAISAIELYNKPDFRYREESFAILMSNAWELLLKAKALKDGGERLDNIIETKKIKNEKTGNIEEVPKTNRSGNAMTIGLGYLAPRMFSDKVEGITKECLRNIELLIEIRDNAIHFMNADLALSKTVLEVGTAALKNYMSLAIKWFGVDFSRYNFFLMPLSFFHGFETAKGISVTPATEQAKKFLEYMATIKQDSPEDAEHYVTLSIETRVMKGKGSDGMAVRWTDDPTAPAVTFREEDLLEKYPYDTGDLREKLRDRYSDFKQDKRYYKIKKPLDSDLKYCKVRYLDPKNAKSGSKKFYSPEVFKVFDLHYKKKDSSYS